ncbi:MAG: hypothetical protein SNJ33_04680 [Rikenellaceae bacterium]
MKKIQLALIALCAAVVVACGGNAAVDKINQLVLDATEQTQAAESIEEVAQIAASLQEEMDKITAEAGDKLTLGKSVDESLAKYQEAAKAKLGEFGIELNIEAETEE